MNSLMGVKQNEREDQVSSGFFSAFVAQLLLYTFLH